MARNTGAGYRQGILLNRSQTFNPITNKFMKRDTETGKFVSAKDTPFKNVRKEKKKDKN